MNSTDSLSTPAEQDLLVVFSDLTLFSRTVRGSSSLEVLDFLSDYYEFVGSVLEGAGGRVVKFMGDATLAVFPADAADAAVQALVRLKAEGDQRMADLGFPCRHVIKAHLGPVACGLVGTEKDKRFDVFGVTVNTAAMLPSRGLALSPQAFRGLSPETRKLFKKHTPPVTYIPVDEAHRD